MTSLLETIRDKDSRPSVGFDVVRIYLGIALLVRGALFVAEPSRVFALIRRSGHWFLPMAGAHYVAMAHLGGGILLAIGLGTRLAAAIQIPILFGAVFFVHWDDGLLNPSQSLELAGLVLVLLITYAVFGAGPLSVDARLRRGRVAPSEKEGHEPGPMGEISAGMAHRKPST